MYCNVLDWKPLLQLLIHFNDVLFPTRSNYFLPGMTPGLPTPLQVSMIVQQRTRLIPWSMIPSSKTRPTTEALVIYTFCCGYFSLIHYTRFSFEHFCTMSRPLFVITGDCHDTLIYNSLSLRSMLEISSMLLYGWCYVILYIVARSDYFSCVL